MLPTVPAAIVGNDVLRHVVTAGYILSRCARIPQMFGSLLWVTLLRNVPPKLRIDLPAVMTMTACKIPD